MGVFEEEIILGLGYSERDSRLLSYLEIKALIREREQKRLDMWEVIRWQVFNMIQLSPDIKKTDKPKRLEDILKLPTDKPVKREIIEVTEQEKEVLKDIFNGINR